MDTSIRNSVRNRIDELKTLRDEIRVDLKLVEMDLRDEWTNLEKRIPETTRLASDIKNVTVQTLDELLEELRRFRGWVADRRQGRGNRTGAP